MEGPNGKHYAQRHLANQMEKEGKLIYKCGYISCSNTFRTIPEARLCVVTHVASEYYTREMDKSHKYHEEYTRKSEENYKKLKLHWLWRFFN